MAQITINFTRVNRMINGGQSTLNLPDELSVGENNSASQIQRGVLLMPFTGLPAGAIITGVTLQLYNHDNSLATNTRTMRFYRAKRVSTAALTWDTSDGSTPWGTAGAGNTTSDREATDVGSVSVLAAQAIGYFNITLTPAAIQEWFDGVFTNNGFIIQMDTETDDLHELQGSPNPPKWIIDYTLPDITVKYGGSVPNTIISRQDKVVAY